MIKFKNKIKPRVVCKYSRENRDSILGVGVGINITNEVDDRKNYIDKLIDSVNLLKKENTKTILLDNIYEFKYSEVVDIEKKTNLKVPYGRWIKVKLLPNVLMRICEYNDIDLYERNILIIGDDSEDTSEVIDSLADKVNYLSLVCEDCNFGMKMKGKILFNYGLSIETVKTVKDLKKYKVIINLNNNIDINPYRINKNTMIFDLSNSRKVSRNLNDKRKDVGSIEDFILVNKSNVNSDTEEFEMDKEVTSNIYDNLNDKVDLKHFAKIMVNKKMYTIEEMSKLFLNNKNNMSKFHVKC
ncbi:hypothetical protein [Dethiothermospora halolimnae]|uniref:hypothetical protein n=1 Tax=Dethiothermospora halolimnae TaxID=3114390 RepID=UPI003CCC2D56